MSEVERFRLPLSQRVLAESVGAALSLVVILGSGISAHRLATFDTGLLGVLLVIAMLPGAKNTALSISATGPRVRTTANPR